MDALREHFDYIIVDTPPIGVVIDAAIIAQRCDGTVLITESGANGRKAVQKAKDQLEQTGTPFLGVVLNKFNIKAAEYGIWWIWILRRVREKVKNRIEGKWEKKELNWKN